MPRCRSKTVLYYGAIVKCHPIIDRYGKIEQSVYILEDGFQVCDYGHSGPYNVGDIYVPCQGFFSPADFDRNFCVLAANPVPTTTLESLTERCNALEARIAAPEAPAATTIPDINAEVMEVLQRLVIDKPYIVYGDEKRYCRNCGGVKEGFHDTNHRNECLYGRAEQIVKMHECQKKGCNL